MNPVARNIITIRSQHKLTQLELAKMADLPRSTIANMESANSNPTISAVIKIATALGVSVSDLIEKNQYSFATLVGRDEMRTTTQDDDKLSITLLSPLNAPYILMNKICMLPGCDTLGKPHPMGSHEFYYSLKGDSVLEINDDRVKVQEGDLVYFSGNLPHRYINDGNKAVHAISVVNMKASTKS